MSLDCTIRRGTNRPIQFVMPADFDMTGKSFELVVEGGGVRRVYTQAAGLTIAGQVVTWAYSLADSRSFPEGRIATLELQWSQGSAPDQVQDSDTGFLTVETGISND